LDNKKTKKELQRNQKELIGGEQMKAYREKMHRGAKFLDMRNELIEERIKIIKLKEEMQEDNEQMLAAYYQGIETALNHVVKELNAKIFNDRPSILNDTYDWL